MWQDFFIQLLKKYFEEAKAKNPRFSMRGYALKLGLSVSTLSDLLAGKSSLSEVRALAILEKINCPSRKKNKILLLMKKELDLDQSELPSQLYSVFSDWRQRGVLFSFDCQPPPSPGQLAKKLGLSELAVQKIITDLLQHKFLVQNRNGEISRDKTTWRTSDGITSEEVRKLHRANVDLARAALEKIPTENRDFTSVTLAIKADALPRLRQEIRDFYSRIITLMDEESCSEVMQVSIQAFPLCHELGEEGPQASALGPKKDNQRLL